MGELDANTAEIVIDTRVDPSGACIITVAGELDISNVASLEAAIASVTQPMPQQIIFDLSDLRFMDSAGIAVLVNITSTAIDVQLRHPSPIIRRVLETTGLTSVLPIES